MSKDIDPEDKRICSRCVGEKFLRAKVFKTSDKGQCSYCGKDGKTVSIGELADEIGGAFERHYYRTPRGPSDYEYLLHTYDASDLSWERDGEPAVSAIAYAAGLKEEPAEDVRAVLEESTGSFDDIDDGDEEAEFSTEAQYEERDTDSTKLYQQWQNFKRALRTETRLFNSTAQAVLDSIFSGIDGHTTRDGRKIIVDAGPRQKISGLYRARVFQSDEKLIEALKRPDLELGPPPSAVASAGRMNASGIAVFYGATHSEVAIAETRPPVGSRVLVARFAITRELKLLDVEALRKIYVKGSIFDSSHLERLKKAAFLATLSAQITAPVMPDDGPFEYLVTQAIADYLANLTVPSLDGIIYRSVQHGRGKNNVVLFHKSALVKPLDLPRGSQISAHLYDPDEERMRPDYWVFEAVPSPEEQNDPALSFPFDFPEGARGRDMTRNPALSIDMDSLRVHHVEGATYSTEIHETRRHRTTMSLKMRGTRRSIV